MILMKIIDFHTHIFTDKIAPLAIANLEKHYQMPWQRCGTLEDMKSELTTADFDAAVVFATPTKPTQVIVNNDFLFSIKNEKFIVFGSVHPDFENVADEIERVKKNGLKGFKFHPDFQQFNIDDEKALFMYDKIGDEYPIVLHTGDKTLKYSSPERLSRVLEIFPTHKFVAAHMGGYSVWDSEAKSLIGKNVYFDTSSTLWCVSNEKMTEMIRAHGADKVLFGTDYPAVSLKWEAERILNLDLTEEEKEAIMYGNAKKLLKL